MFKKVKRHLLKQKRKCVLADGLCAFTNEDGLMCSVGVLIEVPPNTFDPFTDPCAPEVIEILSEKGWPTDDKSIALLYELVDVHDYFPVNEWESCLLIIEEKLSPHIVGER